MPPTLGRVCDIHGHLGEISPIRHTRGMAIIDAFAAYSVGLKTAVEDYQAWFQPSGDEQGVAKTPTLVPLVLDNANSTADIVSHAIVRGALPFAPIAKDEASGQETPKGIQSLSTLISVSDIYR